MRYLLLISLFILSAYGCGWVNGTTISGRWVENVQIRERYGVNIDSLKYILENSTPTKRLTHFKNNFSAEERNNALTQAVFSMLDGNYTEAITMFLEEETREPGRYEVAANLGTAYELSGDNTNALRWIQEGIKRNPDSHHGTEWIHVNILEAKLQLQDNKDYLKEHHVIDIETAPDQSSLKWAMLYQLQERMLFVKPKDPIVADLLYTYAVANAEGWDTGFLEYSMEALELAQKYGYENPNELANTIEEYQDIIDTTAMLRYLKFGMYLILFLIILFIAYKKKLLTPANIFKQSDKMTGKSKPLLVLANIMYFILFLPFVVFAMIVAVEFLVTPTSNEPYIYLFIITLSIIIELVLMKLFNNFLTWKHLQVKNVTYGLFTGLIGLLLLLAVPFMLMFGLDDQISLVIFISVALFIIALFAVNDGMKEMKKADGAKNEIQPNEKQEETEYIFSRINTKIKVGHSLLFIGVVALFASVILGAVSLVAGVGFLMFGYILHRDGNNEREILIDEQMQKKSH